MLLLTDLPLDALSCILRILDPTDLVAVGLTCKRLGDVVNLDSLWAPHCCRWLEQQPDATGLGGVGLPDLQQALSISTNKLLYEALFTLGAWPVGVWYASSEGACRPFGQILVVEQQAGRVFVGSLLEAGAAPGPTIIQDDIWEYHEFFSISITDTAEVGGVEDSGAKQPAVQLEWHFPGDRASSLSISRDAQELVAYHGYPDGELPTQASARLLRGSPDAPPAPEQQEIHFRRMQLNPPARQHPQLQETPTPAPAGPEVDRGGFDGAALLQRLQGVYTACYGPHGMEVLQLRMAGPREPAPPGCDITGTRLQAFKITGDPNVEALQFSFVVDAAQCKPGRYDPQQDDPFPPHAGFARLVLSFFQSATIVLHLEDRPAVARFRALGQINQVPGIWDPQFVAATMVVYEEGYRLPFTIIFEDEGVQVRHAMDFFPLSIPVPGFDRRVDRRDMSA